MTPPVMNATTFAVSAEFWSGKRVFLTGHTGFKGSWMLHWLDLLGATVRGFALPPDTTPSMFTQTEAGRLCDHVIGDVRDAAALRAAVVDFKPDIVIHMAAQPLVRRSYRDPAATVATNVMGTVNLLEAVRACDSVGSVVIVTTDKCYVNNEWAFAYRENDRLGGKDPYSASKACTEIITQSWRDSFFAVDTPLSRRLPVASARAGNVFGGGDYSEDRLIPDAVRAFTSGNPLVIRAPAAVRPWQHCLDPIAGYLYLARACFEDGTDLAAAYNFGPSADQMPSVGDLATVFADQWGDGATWQHQPGDAHLKEAGLLLLDSSLAQRTLGWRQASDLQTGLAATAVWYRAAAAGASPAKLADLTRAQIADLTDGAGSATSSHIQGPADALSSH
ncbi:CDP-glucose 4,6-dehydratase [Loktanella fryxellensis]|uniref:CDP-glucose 4,6-dehydratase n=2 Tax=Loktanella fryxellensis TaxID=245187 RepID=A0A1H8H5N9_9RHOB|nr:CDP-glucose 4,6-dehydratase [Loktanella fryxellensis]